MYNNYFLPCKSLDLRGEFLYVVILLARINTCIQALLRQGFGILSAKTKPEKRENGKLNFSELPPMNLAVVMK